MDAVEAALAADPDVAEATVVQAGPSSIVAVVPRPPRTAADIRDHLWDALPAERLPDLVTAVDRLPHDASGRILAGQVASEALAGQGACGFLTPWTSVEVELAQTWREVLGRRHIATQDSFFDLGGDPTTATVLLDLTDQRFGLKLSLAELRERPTLREVAAAIDDARVWGEVPVNR